MAAFLFQTVTISAFTSALGILVLALVWPDPFHMWNAGEWRHILRYMGVGLILLSLLFSLRKRVLKSWGRLPSWLLFHEYATVVGFLLVLFHVFGYRYYAVLPWILFGVMTVCVGTGLWIKWLFIQAKSAKKGSGPPVHGQRIKLLRPVHLWSGVASITLTAVHAGIAYLYGGY